MNNKYTNRLAEESSPYLLQHAHNPVDWFPWGEEAFEKARSGEKLIFLSIGYSTCHWCHVMERECFEDEEVAELMNAAFVSIKVDREERPDIDAIYMEVSMMLNGSGGWPLNLVLTPDLQPVFAATYIPKRNMTSIVPQVQSAWKERRDEIVESGQKITTALQERNREIKNSLPDQDLRQRLPAVYDAAYKGLADRYDEEYGGFGTRPKFPQPHNFLFLLRHYTRTGNAEALRMTGESLRHMRAGGIYDQFGFGFHRYSTDREWLVPHFEKMLYDQAMLLLAYCDAFLVTGKELYRRTARELLTYLRRDMLSPEGAFYSAEDADSEGVEGKYYLWEAREFYELLDGKGDDYAEYFHVEKDGNYLDEAGQVKTGSNILHTEPGAKLPEGRKKFDDALRTLFLHREERIRPDRDDKILTDWNGLLIFALARASWILGDELFYTSAENAVQYIENKMRSEDGGLIHSYRNGIAGTAGMLDDYSFCIRGLLALYEAGFDPGYLKNAIELAEYAETHFLDREGGGFYLSSDSRKNLIVRKKEFIDNAVPSGNSVMLENYILLFRMTGDEKYRAIAEGIIKTSMDELRRYPQAFPMLLASLHAYSENPREIILCGKGEEIDKMIGAVRGTLRPGTVILVKTPETKDALAAAAPYTGAYPVPEEGASAYVCENFACKRPVYSKEALLEILS